MDGGLRGMIRIGYHIQESATLRPGGGQAERELKPVLLKIACLFPYGYASSRSAFPSLGGPFLSQNVSQNGYGGRAEQVKEA